MVEEMHDPVTPVPVAEARLNLRIVALKCELAERDEQLRALRGALETTKAMIEARGNPRADSKPTQHVQGAVLAEIYAGVCQALDSTALATSEKGNNG